MLRSICDFVVILCAFGSIVSVGCVSDDNATDNDVSTTTLNSGRELVSDAPSSPMDRMPLKAAPARPLGQPGVMTDGKLPAKPAGNSVSSLVATSSIAWTVNLTASSESLWSLTYTTLAATTNMDVGPTPYFIRIWDSKAGAFLATCGSGTTCSIAVTRANVDLTSFRAVVATSEGFEVTSSSIDVYWHISDIKLTTSATTVAVGGSSTLTAVTDYDVGPSPFYVRIYDDTTATLLASCGTGTKCRVAVSQGTATTHRFSACLTGVGLLECTMEQYVTWSNLGINVSLKVSAMTSTTVTVAATSSVDVSATPYYIQIYNMEGDLMASCGAGTTCTATFTPASNDGYLRAFVGQWSSTLPAAGLPRASSSVISLISSGFDCGCTNGSFIGQPPHIGPVGYPPLVLYSGGWQVNIFQEYRGLYD